MSTVREQFWQLAAEVGMTTVFGNPGSTEMTYVSDFPDSLRYILGLQEGAVTSMADGFAQVTGGPVLVNLHTAPGIGNAMGALLTARDSRAPLVMTAGNQVRSMLTSRQWLTDDEPTLLPSRPSSSPSNLPVRKTFLQRWPELRTWRCPRRAGQYFCRCRWTTTTRPPKTTRQLIWPLVR